MAVHEDIIVENPEWTTPSAQRKVFPQPVTSNVLRMSNVDPRWDGIVAGEVDDLWPTQV